MRGTQNFQETMFSYISLEERVRAKHPLRKLRNVPGCRCLAGDHECESEAVYVTGGRPWVPPEMLLKALLLQILFSIRSERLLVVAINYNLLYRPLVYRSEPGRPGLGPLDVQRQARATFNKDLARVFFEGSNTPPNGPSSPATNTSVWTARRLTPGLRTKASSAKTMTARHAKATTQK
jgi:hypothetical protein